MLIRIFSLICLTLVGVQYVVSNAAGEMWYVGSLQPSQIQESLYLINAENMEIPYVLLKQKSTTSSIKKEVQPVRIVENTVQKYENGLERIVVLDTAKEGQIYTGIDIAPTTDSKNFNKIARVFVSDSLLGANSPAWRELEKKTIVYNYTEDDFTVENLSIRFPDVSTRYLKIHFVENSSNPSSMNIVEARAVQDTVENVSRRIKDYVAGNFDISKAPYTKDVKLENNTFTDAAFVNGITLNVDANLTTFRKTASVEISEDGVTWKEVGRGEIYRIKSPVYEGEYTTIYTDTVSAPYMRINTDLPLENTAQVIVQEMAVLFKIDPAEKDDVSILVDTAGIATSSYILQKELGNVGNIVPEVVDIQKRATEVEGQSTKNSFIIYSAIFIIAGILAYLRYRLRYKATRKV